MQALAAEFGLSETAYLRPEDDVVSLPLVHPGDRGRPVRPRHPRWPPTRSAGWGRCCDGDVVTFTTRSGRLTAGLSGDLIELGFPAEPAAAIAVPPPSTAADPGPT